MHLHPLSEIWTPTHVGGINLKVEAPLSGFSPHWSEVVGSNHLSVIFITTHACFTTTHIGQKVLKCYV